MADILSPHNHILLLSEPTAPLVRSSETLMIPPAPVSVPQSGLGLRSGHLNLDNFSPVNQDGSFAFDRVLKSGEVLKRTRKTKVNDSIPALMSLLISGTVAMETLSSSASAQPALPL